MRFVAAPFPQKANAFRGPHYYMFGNAAASFLRFRLQTGNRTREGVSVIRMFGEHSDSERSEGDRKGSRGGSMQAERSRRSIPDESPRRSKLRCYQKTALEPFFSCASLLLLFPKKLTLSGGPITICLGTQLPLFFAFDYKRGIEPERA